jgi:cytochrome c553
MHMTGSGVDARGPERERALGRAIYVRCIGLAAVLLAYPAASVAVPIEDKARVCAACHGSDGLPKDKTIPILWGQNAAYLYLQLRDFEKGERKSELMSPIAHDVVKDDALELAEYFADKEWPRTHAPSASAPLAATATAINKSVPCTTCHMDRFQGDATVPRLAGQQRDYLVKTLMDFRSRARANNPAMSELMSSLTPEQIQAIASYLAAL